jgi:dipicolinate synthase subunit B
VRFKGRKIGFALTGSHCTIPEVLPVIESLVKDGAGVLAIVSESVRDTDTRFGTAEELMRSLARITGAQPISTVAEAEPLGPKRLLDCLVIAPCTGNTAARLANGIVDGPVTMAAKAQLRNKRPVVIAISTNDGLGLNAKNIGVLLNTPDIYMVPYRQDNPAEKPKSIVALMHRIPDTIESAINGKQIQPIIVGPC